MTAIRIPSARDKVLNDDGTMNPVWHEFLRLVADAVNANDAARQADIEALETEAAFHDRNG